MESYDVSCRRAGAECSRQSGVVSLVCLGQIFGPDGGRREATRGDPAVDLGLLYSAWCVLTLSERYRDTEAKCYGRYYLFLFCYLKIKK